VIINKDRDREMHRVQARTLGGDMIRKKSFNLRESYIFMGLLPIIADALTGVSILRPRGTRHPARVA
jgi:hypothetical protein